MYSMSNKKYKDRYVTSMAFERSVFFGLRDLLPHDVDVSDEINTFLKEKYEELSKEKNLIGQVNNRSPVQLVSYTTNKQSTLDKYFPQHLQDISTMLRLMRSDLSEEEIRVLGLSSRSLYNAAKLVYEEKTNKNIELFAKQIR